MPAVSLRTFRPVSISDRTRQASFFKLWLLLTAITETTAGNAPAPVFFTAADVNIFVAAQAGNLQTAYYVDMTDIGTATSPLPNLKQSDVLAIFSLLNDASNLTAFQTVAGRFQKTAGGLLGYPHAGCTSYARVLSLGPIGPDPDMPGNPTP